MRQHVSGAENCPEHPAPRPAQTCPRTDCTGAQPHARSQHITGRVNSMSLTPRQPSSCQLSAYPALHCLRKVRSQAAALAVPGKRRLLSAGGSWAAHPTYRCSTTQGLAGSHTPPAGPAASCSWPSAIQKLPRRPPGQPLPPAHCTRTPGPGAAGLGRGGPPWRAALPQASGPSTEPQPPGGVQ